MRRVLLFLSLASSPIGAQSLSDVPNVWDLAVASGTGTTTISGALSRSAYLGTSGKLVAGFGIRGLFLTGNSEMDPVDAPAFVAPDKLKTATSAVTVNIGLNVGYEFTQRLSAGLNLDVFGFTVGGDQSGTLVDPVAGSQSVTVKPDSPNLFEGGSSDKGLLTSEFFASWMLNDHYAIRAGLSRQLIQYQISSSSSTVTSSSNTYRRMANLIFLGLRFTAPQ